ncbi:PRC-barrel domain containing protein [Kitasatospora purpeofusca]|uniref:PRC-barrel domain containing protein n=1 Tax=Kitasatospora purpeofusca TaxID=67352 RepID=UPI0036C2A69B
MSHDIWGYPEASQYTPGTDLNGYKVEATDGTVGKVDDATDEVGSAYIVVNCKPWLIGKHVMLPAGTVTRVDHDDETIYVNRTKDQIKDAPEYDPDTHKNDPAYRTTLGSYYGSHDR